MGSPVFRLVVAVLLALVVGLTLVWAQPSGIGPAQMTLRSQDGYSSEWWIYSIEESCLIEFTVKDPKGQRVTHWRGPCTLFSAFFHLMREYKGA
mgnify:FL=1